MTVSNNLAATFGTDTHFSSRPLLDVALGISHNDLFLSCYVPASKVTLLYPRLNKKNAKDRKHQQHKRIPLKLSIRYVWEWLVARL